MDKWLEKIQNDQVVILDGATGTELQRRGVPMDEVAWAGAAVLTHPEIVRDVHIDYVHAGAEVIIANTFGSTRQMLAPAGFEDHVETVNRKGIELAVEAREATGASVAVAGSISAMPPGFDRNAYFSPADELESYREATRILADAGADLIALEMMEDVDHASRALQAALESQLPVWLGISCKANEDGELVGFGRPDIPLRAIIDALLPMGPTVVNLMHTHSHIISQAIPLVRQKWNGPLGAYPESGYFTKPNWNFVDVISPEDLLDEARNWVSHGVRLVGGCCGTSPEHIVALANL